MKKYLIASLFSISLFAQQPDYFTGIKNKPYISVKDLAYQAKGNGTTDDTTAIHNATLAACAQGKILYFPIGNYKVTATNIAGTTLAPCNLMIKGDHSALTTITVASSAGAITYFDNIGQIFNIDGITQRQTGTNAVQFFHARNTGGGLQLQMRDYVAVSLSTSAVDMILFEDTVFAYIIDSRLVGPQVSTFETQGINTTSRVVNCLNATAPASNQNTTLVITRSYFTGCKYGTQVASGYQVDFTKNVEENNWIGIHGTGGSLSSHKWYLDGNWFERNRYLGGFFGDPADPTNNAATVAPREVIITENNTYNDNYQFIYGPSVEKEVNTTDVSTGAADFSTRWRFPDAASASWKNTRKVTSTLPMRVWDCWNPTVGNPCYHLYDSTNGVVAGQISKYQHITKSMDAATAVWYTHFAAEGGILYIGTTDSLLKASATSWRPIYFLNNTGVYAQITANGSFLSPGDYISQNIAGTSTMRCGYGTFSLTGGWCGTVSNNTMNFGHNSIVDLYMDSKGVHFSDGAGGTGLPVYANNAAAAGAGLAPGTLYRLTGTDTVNVVH